jgi:hypothetical protein
MCLTRVNRRWHEGDHNMSSNDPELPLIEKVCAVLTVIALCVLVVFCAFGEEKKDEAAPLTAVVITQCNQLVAAYVTMPDGRLIRFDKASGVPFSQAVEIVSSAAKTERIEVACEKSHAPLALPII